MSKDLTMHEAIADNMIALVNAADGMDRQSFARLLQRVALRLAANGGKLDSETLSTACTPDSQKVGVSTTDFLCEGFWAYPQQAHSDGLSPIPRP